MASGWFGVGCAARWPVGSDKMRKWGMVAAMAVMMTSVAQAAPAPDAAIAAALADKDRPESDISRDGARKPGELLAFAGVKPGAKVGELLPGGAISPV